MVQWWCRRFQITWTREYPQYCSIPHSRIAQAFVNSSTPCCIRPTTSTPCCMRPTSSMFQHIYYAKAPKTTASLKLGRGDVVKAKKKRAKGKTAAETLGNAWCKAIQPTAFPHRNRTSDFRNIKENTKEGILRHESHNCQYEEPSSCPLKVSNYIWAQYGAIWCKIAQYGARWCNATQECPVPFPCSSTTSSTFGLRTLPAAREGGKPWRPMC